MSFKAIAKGIREQKEKKNLLVRNKTAVKTRKLMRNFFAASASKILSGNRKEQFFSLFLLPELIEFHC